MTIMATKLGARKRGHRRPWLPTRAACAVHERSTMAKFSAATRKQILDDLMTIMKARAEEEDAREKARNRR